MKPGDIVVCINPDASKFTFGRYVYGQPYEIRQINDTTLLTKVDSKGNTDNGYGKRHFKLVPMSKLLKIIFDLD